MCGEIEIYMSVNTSSLECEYTRVVNATGSSYWFYRSLMPEHMCLRQLKLIREKPIRTSMTLTCVSNQNDQSLQRFFFPPLLFILNLTLTFFFFAHNLAHIFNIIDFNSVKKKSK